MRISAGAGRCSGTLRQTRIHLPRMTSLNSPFYSPGFMVLHGNRLEDLRDLMTQFLKSQPLGALVPEIMLVQSNGMKHWLEMALADDAAMGICAATRMELPGTFLWQIYRQVLGQDVVPLHMPFDKTSLVWRLFRLLPKLAASDVAYQPLKHYMGEPVDSRKLYQLALQVADVLDGYQSYRADWLSDWAQGEDVLRIHSKSAGEASSVLAEAHRWQAQLWRDIRQDVGPAQAESSRASVHSRFMEALQKQAQDAGQRAERPYGLPPRIVVFGISSLPTQTIEALAVLGNFCQVLMLVLNPCQYYWGDARHEHAQLRQSVRRRQQDKPGAAHSMKSGEFAGSTQPLLASWGKQGRDYLQLLSEFDNTALYRHQLTRVDAFVDPLSVQDQPTQLAQLQSLILNLEPAPSKPIELDQSDDSLTLVSTYSPQREVEVLHDHLLALFDADAQLQPREVMVMVPDMALFAPHIQAVFGRFALGQSRHIPYTVADNTSRQSPVVQALSQLLSLPQTRSSLLEWFSLLEVDAVRKRLDFTESDVEQVLSWLSAAGVRWGVDAQHRQTWGFAPDVPAMDQNTWAFGLRRLLLGYALGADTQGVWAGTLSQVGVDSLDATLVSKLLDWFEAMRVTLQALSVDHTPEQWLVCLVDLVERFFEPTDAAQERLIEGMLEVLEDWQQVCADAALETPVPLQVVSAHWLASIQEEGLQQRFFGGGVQFASLMPMRAIPFKVVCLLGMNDGAYPRLMVPRDFDLMTSSWRAGDRSRREDDRYLFLEAVLSAREKLYISWQGQRASDNAEQPPSVLVAQLIDFLNIGWQAQRAARQYPLQAFSEAYFVQGSGLSTFDSDWARLHRPPVHPMNQTSPCKGPTGAESGAPVGSISLDELRRLVRQPVEVFFRNRLGISLDAVQERLAQDEPFELKGLEKYQVGQTLLDAANLEQALENVQLSGMLPMAAFGDKLVADLRTEVGVVLARRQPWSQAYPQAAPPHSLHVAVDAYTITGTLSGLFASAQPNAFLQLQQRLGKVAEGKGQSLSARAHVVAGLWVNHVAACASGLALVSVQLGLDQELVFNPLPAAQAMAILKRWITAYQAALQQPLPVACKTAWAYLLARRQTESSDGESPGGSDGQAENTQATESAKQTKDPHEAAAAVFAGSAQEQGEGQASPYLARAFADYDDIEAHLPHWADLIYGDMARHVQVGSSAQGQP